MRVGMTPLIATHAIDFEPHGHNAAALKGQRTVNPFPFRQGPFGLDKHQMVRTGFNSTVAPAGISKPLSKARMRITPSLMDIS